MIEALSQIEILLSKATGKKITHLIAEEECEEYSGFNFSIDRLSIKFRKAKITPKKAGQFVTLWKRGLDRQTEPFNTNDHFDFYIIATEQEGSFGFFLFPKIVLSERKVLTTGREEGKRGTRVYPGWTNPENKQAEKTQSWQLKYFIDLAEPGDQCVGEINRILSGPPGKI